MGFTLIVNAGSSSLKTAIYKGERRVLGCEYERLGEKTIFHGRREKRRVDLIDAGHALRHNIAYLREEGYHPITRVVHRVVHGGEFYSKAARIDKKLKDHIAALAMLAPLHNSHNLEGIEMAQRLLPKTEQFAVFDTAYHQTIPEHSYRYALPKEYYEKHHIRTYGFHGTNHKYLALAAKKACGAKRVITIHLGNGCSITANKNNRSIETSMGFTPAQGLLMGTRSGTLDPQIPLHLQRHIGLTPQRVHDIINYESGLKGLTGKEDMRDVWAGARKGEKDCKLAIEMLAHQIKKYVASYDAILEGADTIVFSGGIGEKAWYVREKALSGLEYAGIKLSKAKNKKVKDPTSIEEIHTPASGVNILVIPADEELQMVRETRQL